MNTKERHLSPNNGIDSNDTLPAKMHKMIYNVLSEFEFSINECTDISKHVLVSNIETALKDSIPMFVFFMMYANKAKEREEYYSEQLKRMEAESVKHGTGKTISANKAGIKSNKVYLKTQAAIRRYRTIRRNCEDLGEAMKMRKEIAQTKSADARKEFGGYNF